MSATTGSRSVEMTAWMVLLAAFAVFLLALFGIPYLLLQYVHTSTVGETAHVASKTGSVMLESTAGITQVMGAGQRRDGVPEGITVTTYPDASAYVRLFDESVLHLRPATSVGLRRMRRPRFAAGADVWQIQLYAVPTTDEAGGFTVGSAYGDVALEVFTPHGHVYPGPDSQAHIEVAPERLKVVGGRGQVLVSGAGQTVALAFDQRTSVEAGRPPATPTAAEENVVRDPGFDKPLDGDNPWLLFLDPPSPASHGQQVLTEDGRTVLRFERQGAEGRPGDLYVRQPLRTDVSEARHLSVAADLEVLSQALPGGGIRASEFPLILTLIYVDENGDEARWETGFYAVPLPPDDTVNQPLNEITSQQVPAGAWYHFDSGNLLDAANRRGLAEHGLPAPKRLSRIEVKASGHDLESQVDEVGVWVK